MAYAPGVSRCHAKSKREREAVPIAAVKGCGVCRMHGAGSSIPKGSRNGLKHGLLADAIEARRFVAEWTRQARELVKTIDSAGSSVFQP